jgi:hypothetical protein
MADTQKALEDLLESHAAVGQEVHEGQFTLSSQSALSKLASFQLPLKGAWIADLPRLISQLSNNLGTLPS